MRIDLGARVRTRDGQRAGHVTQAIWDPERNEIRDYVVGTGGLLGHDVVISSDLLAGASRDGDEIAIELTKSELDELGRYEASDYTSPPAEWVAPEATGFPAGAYLWPVAGSTTAATDAVPSIGAPPPAAKPERRSARIRKGMNVRDRSGEVIGVVEEVRLEEQTGELRTIVVRLGGAFDRVVKSGETIAIDTQHLDIANDEVRLVSDRGEVLGRERA